MIYMVDLPIKKTVVQFGTRSEEEDRIYRAKSHSPEAERKRAQTASTKAELKSIIRTIMESPVNGSEVIRADGKISIEKFKGKNTDVQTRMILQMALNAMRGDKASAEFLMKYGGYEPIKEQKVTIERPTLINDFWDKDSDMSDSEILSRLDKEDSDE